MDYKTTTKRMLKHQFHSNQTFDIIFFYKAKMKTTIVFAALVAVALAAPQGNSDVVVTKESPLNNIGVDGYDFGYELSNGESRQESAQLKNAGTENEAIVVTGSFSWVDPATNQKYTVNFVADENGFHPQGAHIPA